MTIDELVKQYTLKILAENNGNRTKTAWDLGITCRTLRNWLKKWR